MKLPSSRLPGIPLELDDLPAYSPWPERLLNAREAVVHPKDRDNVLREFEREKWRGLLDRLIGTGRPDLATLEALIFPPGREQACLLDGHLRCAAADVVQGRYLSWLRSLLEPLGTFDCVAELGGGAGNVLLQLARHTRLGRRWVSCELAPAGRRMTELVAAREGLDVATCPADFDSGSLQLPVRAGERVLCYSSFSLVYSRDPLAFLTELADQVDHLLVVEPVYQFFDASHLLGLLARRYFEYNDYSTALWPSIEGLVRDGRFEVAGVAPNAFGHNPLCPVSAIHLRTRGR